MTEKLLSVICGSIAFSFLAIIPITIVAISFREEIANAIRTKLISLRCTVSKKRYLTLLVRISDTKKYFGKLVPTNPTLSVSNLQIIGAGVSNGDSPLNDHNRVIYSEFEAAVDSNSEYFSVIIYEHGYTTLYSPYKEGISGCEKRYTTIVIEHDKKDYETVLTSILRCSRNKYCSYEKRHELMAECV